MFLVELDSVHCCRSLALHFLSSWGVTSLTKIIGCYFATYYHGSLPCNLLQKRHFLGVDYGSTVIYSLIHERLFFCINPNNFVQTLYFKILPEILLLRHQVVKYFFLPSNIIANRDLKIVREALYYYQMYASILRLLCN